MRFNLNKLKTIAKEYLGEGLQSFAYKSAGQIIKEPIPLEVIVQKVKSRNRNFTLKKSREVAMCFSKCRKVACEFILQNENLNILANSKLIDNEIIIQDEVIMLKNVLIKLKKDNDISGIKNLIIQVVKGHFKLWNLGGAELTFGINKWGINKHGNVVIYDFGEISPYYDDLSYLIKLEWWNWTNKYLPLELTNEIREQFGLAFNKENQKLNFCKKNFISTIDTDSLINPIKKLHPLGSLDEK